MASKEKKKEEALRRMRILGLAENAVKDFEKNGTVYRSDGGYKKPEIFEFKPSIEERLGFLKYRLDVFEEMGVMPYYLITSARIKEVKGYSSKERYETHRRYRGTVAGYINNASIEGGIKPPAPLELMSEPVGYCTYDTFYFVVSDNEEGWKEDREMMKGNMALVLRERCYCPYTEAWAADDGAAERFYDYETVKVKRTEFGAIVPDWPKSDDGWTLPFSNI